MDKTYLAAYGFRNGVLTRDLVMVKPAEGKAYALKHVLRHSPDGFSWGYEGSGPAELARCILIDLLGYTPAPSLYQAFKREFIAPLAQDQGFTIESRAIMAWLDKNFDAAERQELDWSRV